MVQSDARLVAKLGDGDTRNRWQAPREGMYIRCARRYLVLSDIDIHAKRDCLQLEPHEALRETRAALEGRLRANCLECEGEHCNEQIKQQY